MPRAIKYERIYRELRARIEAGAYAPGDAVPSELELAREWEVSRITSRKALALLAESGLVERRRGKGTFVRAAARTEPAGARNIAAIIDHFNASFGSELLRAVERACAERDVGLLLYCTYGSAEEENRALARARAAGVDGLLLMCVQGEVYNDAILKLALKRFPIVLVDRNLKGLAIPCVMTDNAAAARALTEAMLARGHRRLCFVTHGLMSTSTVSDRYKGFCEAVVNCPGASAALEVLESYHTTPRSVVSEYLDYDLTDVLALLERQEACTAFVCVEHTLGTLLSRACRETGMRRDIGLFDGPGGPIAEMDPCPLILQGEYAMGTLAVESLLRVIAGESVPTVQYVPFRLMNAGKSGERAREEARGE